MPAVGFILGCMFGGTIAMVFMCCLQINRCNKQKDEQAEKKD